MGDRYRVPVAVASVIIVFNQPPRFTQPGPEVTGFLWWARAGAIP